MDCIKTGKLLLSLRQEKNMTQKAVAETLNVSTQTVSKWERGCGCPDVSLLPEISRLFGVNIEKILSGDSEASHYNGSNISRIKFYYCPVCKNVLTSTGKSEISCCGRKLEPLKPQVADDSHKPDIQTVEYDWGVSFLHPMEKTHHITFAALVNYNSFFFTRLYPEQDPFARLPQLGRGTLYYHCTEHGLMKYKL